MCARRRCGGKLVSHSYLSINGIKGYGVEWHLRKTVGGAVADLDGIFLGLELGDGADGAKDLFLHDLHVLGDVAENGGLDEVALLALALAANLDGSTGLLAVLDVANYGVSLCTK